MRKLFVIGVVLLAMAASTGFAQTDLGTIVLINGDVDGDNMVTNTDLGILLANMDQTTANGDLDGDNRVTSTDLSVLLKNMNMTGDW